MQWVSMWYHKEAREKIFSLTYMLSCADIFENISRTVKKEKYQSEPDTLQVS